MAQASRLAELTWPFKMATFNIGNAANRAVTPIKGPVMQEISVTNFKNQALKLLDKVSKTGRHLILTKYGKPWVIVKPAPVTEKIVLGKLQGAMKLTEDIVRPLGPDEWDACQ